jgi:N-acetylglutamate synthase-like GNAT family acetyltransferase
VITIAPFAPRHAEAVAALILPIQRSEFGIPITLDDQPDLRDVPGVYQRGAGNFWVALDDDVVVGTIGVIDIGNGRGVIRKMFVRAEQRGGTPSVAQRLLDTLVAWCLARDLRALSLGTTAPMRAAHRFYERNGFHEITPTALPADFPRMAVDTRFYQRSL